MKFTWKKSGFTLVELLIVIGIIALLAAILFPVFSQAREKARAATCLSNEKQIGLAFMQYDQDNDETLPIFDTLTGNQLAWDSSLAQYLGISINVSANNNKPPQVLLCPSDYLQLSVGAQASGQFRQTYTMPDTLDASNNDVGIVGQKVGSLFWPGRPLTQVPAPSTTFLLVEAPNTTNEVGRAQLCAGPAGSRGQDLVLSPIHQSGWNYLFVDGHAKWYRPEQTIGTGTMTLPKGMWTIADGD